MLNLSEEFHGCAVLVVEDEYLVRMDMVDTLEEAGFVVFQASSGAAGVESLKAHPELRALLTDIEMPGPINGLALARITHDKYPAAAVMVMSGRIRPGASDMPPNARFFGKPCVPGEIVTALHDLLHASHSVSTRA